MKWNKVLNLNDEPGEAWSVTEDDGIYAGIHGMPQRTASEFERHFYMLGDTRMASMWGIVQDLDLSLEMAAKLDS